MPHPPILSELEAKPVPSKYLALLLAHQIVRPSAGSIFMYVLWEFDDTIMVIGKQELIMNAHVCLCRRSLTLTLGFGPQWVDFFSKMSKFVEMFQNFPLE